MSYLLFSVVLVCICTSITGVGVAGYQFFKMQECDKKTGRELSKGDMWFNLAIAVATGFVGGVCFPYVWWRSIQIHLFCNQ